MDMTTPQKSSQDMISMYDLLLFDLDGLLVNTEELHYRAYAQMCKNRGYHLPWDFPSYFRIAERGGKGIQEELYKSCPDLYRKEPDWSILYEEKRAQLYQLAKTEAVPLMKGVEKLLLEVEKRNIPRAIVTHSPRKLVEDFAFKQPILKSIPTWFCREDYLNPKPSPDGFMKAIHHFGSPKRVLGFEDAVRGIEALQACGVDSVLVGHPDPVTKLLWKDRGVLVIDRIDDILNVDIVNPLLRRYAP